MRNWIEQWRLSNDMNARQSPRARDSEQRAMTAVHESMSKANVPSDPPANLHDGIMRAVRQEAAGDSTSAPKRLPRTSHNCPPGLAFAVGALLIVSLVVALLDWRSPTVSTSPMAQASEQYPISSASQSIGWIVDDSASQSESTLVQIDQTLTAAYTNELASIGRDLASAEAFLRRQMGGFDAPGDSI